MASETGSQITAKLVEHVGALNKRYGGYHIEIEGLSEEAMGPRYRLRKIILAVLEEFAADGHDGANLSSEAARERIADEIVKEIEK